MGVGDSMLKKNEKRKEKVQQTNERTNHKNKSNKQYEYLKLSCAACSRSEAYNLPSGSFMLKQKRRITVSARGGGAVVCAARRSSWRIVFQVSTRKLGVPQAGDGAQVLVMVVSRLQ